jgi:hypothetical protein
VKFHFNLFFFICFIFLVTPAHAKPGDLEDFPDTRTSKEKLWDQEYNAQTEQRFKEIEGTQPKSTRSDQLEDFPDTRTAQEKLWDQEYNDQSNKKLQEQLKEIDQAIQQANKNDQAEYIKEQDRIQKEGEIEAARINADNARRAKERESALYNSDTSSSRPYSSKVRHCGGPC